MLQQRRLLVVASTISTGLAILWTANAMLRSGNEAGMKLEIRPGDHISIIGNISLAAFPRRSWSSATSAFQEMS
jgi:hypothetical protein